MYWGLSVLLHCWQRNQSRWQQTAGPEQAVNMNFSFESEVTTWTYVNCSRSLTNRISTFRPRWRQTRNLRPTDWHAPVLSVLFLTINHGRLMVDGCIACCSALLYINQCAKVGIYWHFEAAKLLAGCKHHEEMMVAGLLCIYILWLGFELQVFASKLDLSWELLKAGCRGWP